MTRQRLLLYQRHITTPRTALLHLLLHCCHKDGECSEAEVNAIRAIISKLHGEADDLEAEHGSYRQYAEQISDDVQYLRYLLHLIEPAHRLALIWHCTQVVASDANMAFSEELLICKLASLLHVSTEETRVLYNLARQLVAWESAQRAARA